METVRIYRLTGLRPRYRAQLYAVQREAAGVWMLCRDLHLAARQQRTPWPREETFQQATRGRFALHSQTIQAIFRAFVGTIEATRERPSLVFPIALPEQSGACKLVWKDGYELHVAVATAPAEASPGSAQATVDLGEIHQAAVTTSTGAALVISGRGIRSLKRRHNRALGQIARKRHQHLAAGVVLASCTCNRRSVERVSLEAGYRCDAAKKLIPFTGLRVSRGRSWAVYAC